MSDLLQVLLHFRAYIREKCFVNYLNRSITDVKSVQRQAEIVKISEKASHNQIIFCYSKNVTPDQALSDLDRKRTKTNSKTS